MKPAGAVRLHTIPMTFRQARSWVDAYHRHNKAPRGYKFAIGAATDAGDIVGVAMAGRPVARAWDDGFTIEVNRSVTTEADPPNVNSYLYAACWRVARAMGYLRAITYTQGAGPGTSPLAAGWHLIAERSARPGWADETADPDLKAMRDPVGNGGVPRKVWEVTAP